MGGGGRGCANPPKNIQHMLLVKIKYLAEFLRRKKISGSLNQGVEKDFARCMMAPKVAVSHMIRFSLMGMTLYNGQHYRGAVKRGDQAWYSYDGLWERNCPGTGLQKGPLTTPAGYIPSSYFYVHSKFV